MAIIIITTGLHKETNWQIISNLRDLSKRLYVGKLKSYMPAAEEGSQFRGLIN